jgi:hypothetical protein
MVFSLEHDIKVTKNHQNLLPTQSVLVAHTVQLRPLKTHTLTTPNFWLCVNSTQSDVSRNVTQTLSTLISLAMAAILTPSLSQTHFCKSDNCDISKVTRDSDLICQILTLTL